MSKQDDLALEDKYAELIQGKHTLTGRIMKVHCYPLEESPIKGNIELDLTLDTGDTLEASVPSSMFRTIQERMFEAGLFIVEPGIENRYTCTAILFGQKPHEFAM
jgi:hypothetical protein